MGAVYAAVTRQEGGVERVFAVKVLHSGDRSAEDIEDFIQEAKLTSHIDHPNVLETFELGMQAGEPFLVMPLLRGVPLSRVLGSLRRRGERLPLELSVWIAAQVAGGLHAAHQITSPDGESLHVVHRDVSPQNVMLGYRGEVLLLDFGVAKLFESGKATASGVIKGKFAYMSPEQLRAEVVDRTTDVFALGVVLFEMLTGRPLFSDLSPPMAALKINADDTPRLSDHVASAPPALDEILARAMAKERRHRFQTAPRAARRAEGLPARGRRGSRRVAARRAHHARVLARASRVRRAAPDGARDERRGARGEHRDGASDRSSAPRDVRGRARPEAGRRPLHPRRGGDPHGRCRVPRVGRVIAHRVR
jgi:serine/threonine protein kinase